MDAVAAAAEPPASRSAEKQRIVLRRYIAQEEKERQQAAVAAAAAAGDGGSAEKRKRGGGERLNDAQRLEIIARRREENPPSLRSLAREFNVSDKSIRNVMLCAEEIEKRNVNVDRKHQLKTYRHAAPRFPALEERVFQWIASLRKVQINPTPAAIIDKTKAFAVEMGIPESEFKASPGWFERFRKRRRLVDSRMSVGGDDGGDGQAAYRTEEDQQLYQRYQQQRENEANANAANGAARASVDELHTVQHSHQYEPQPQQQQQSQPKPIKAVGVYDLLQRLVEFETSLRAFQRLNPPEHGRVQQCLANTSVIRHDLLAVHANMQVRTLRASSGASSPLPPHGRVGPLHAVNELV